MPNLESRAVSLKPGPDVYLGNPTRQIFLEAIRQTSLSVTVQISPSDPRRASYMRRAERDRKRNQHVTVTPTKASTAATPARGVVDGALYMGASVTAFKIVSRSGLPWWAEQDDLVNEGCNAILESGAKEEQLAITVAHRAMVNCIRKESVRQRDREWPEKRGSETSGNLDGERYTPGKPGTAGRDGAVWEALKALPARQHTAIRLCLEGCSHEEVAARMNTTPKGVERLLARARESLREIFNP